MTIIIDDLETTGVSTFYDQAVQFAAICYDDELNLIDRFEIRCRLMPHIIPAPKALLVTGVTINDLTDSALPSFYAMVTAVRAKLQSWTNAHGPALFMGFNSMPFDEEMLRQMFYQCLYDPYLTNTGGNTRADALNLCRMTAAMRPDVLKPAANADGSPTFRLSELAAANSITVEVAHEAMADVLTTRAVCDIVRRRAPEIWARFRHFSAKQNIESFMELHNPFAITHIFGNRVRFRPVTRLGAHSRQANRHYCLDLSADLDQLMTIANDYDALIAHLRTAEGPLVKLRSNRAPTLWDLNDPNVVPFLPLDHSEADERRTRVHDAPHFVNILLSAAQDTEPVHEPSSHVEGQIYQGGFPSWRDKKRMDRFYGATGQQRAMIAKQFEDKRYQTLADRLVYFENPEALGAKRADYDRGVHDRIMMAPEAGMPWRSIPAARQEASSLLEGEISEDDRTRLADYIAWLDRRAAPDDPKPTSPGSVAPSQQVAVPRGME